MKRMLKGRQRILLAVIGTYADHRDVTRAWYEIASHYLLGIIFT